MNSGLPACLAATLMLMVVSAPKVSLMRSIDLTISASTQVSKLVDQSQFHGKMDEGAGGLNDAIVVAQTNQRLDALDILGPDVDLGLKGAAKAFFLDGEPQRLLDLHSCQRLALHAGVEQSLGILAVVLDAINRNFGVLAARHSCGHARDKGSPQSMWRQIFPIHR